jgi:hypothetical protein
MGGKGLFSEVFMLGNGLQLHEIDDLEALI